VSEIQRVPARSKARPNGPRKVAAAASALNLFFVLSSNIENVIGFAVVVLVIFAVGGVAGAYLALKSKFGKKEAVGPASEERE